MKNYSHRTRTLVTGGAGFLGSHLPAKRRLRCHLPGQLLYWHQRQHLHLLAKRTGAKIFQASTSEVYGDPEVHPQPESHCDKFRLLWSCSKLM